MAEKKTKSGRWKIQLMAAAASNPFFFRSFQGTLYCGPLKRVCVPGLNCYSCPAAAGSCPLGALLGVIVLAVFFYRPFCKWICPLGAFYALFNKISLYRFTIDAQACTACGMCSQACGMDVNVFRHPNHAECIRCGDCIRACPHRAIHKTSVLRTRQHEEVNQ